MASDGDSFKHGPHANHSHCRNPSSWSWSSSGAGRSAGHRRLDGVLDSGMRRHESGRDPDARGRPGGMQRHGSGRNTGAVPAAGGYVQSPPGAFWAYANQNFMLAGLIAQKVTGTSYRQLMHERVFEPLGMHRTVFLPSEVLSDGDYGNGWAYADPSDPKRPDGVMHPDSYDNPWARPAGYAWSSVLDMARLAAFLVHGREEVLAHDLWAAMTSPQAVMPPTAGMISYVTRPGTARRRGGRGEGSGRSGPRGWRQRAPSPLAGSRTRSASAPPTASG